MFRSCSLIFKTKGYYMNYNLGMVTKQNNKYGILVLNTFIPFLIDYKTGKQYCIVLNEGKYHRILGENLLYLTGHKCQYEMDLVTYQIDHLVLK